MDNITIPKTTFVKLLAAIKAAMQEHEKLGKELDDAYTLLCWATSEQADSNTKDIEQT